MNHMHVCIFEDRQVTNFSPLVHFRPVYALRCGVQTLLEKLHRLTPRTSRSRLMRHHLASHAREHHQELSINLLPDSACWLVNGRVLATPDLGKLLHTPPKRSHVYRSGPDLVAAFLAAADILKVRNRLLGDGLDLSVPERGDR